MTLRRQARILVCPHCRGGLSWDASRLVCPSRHSFDLSRHGYVNLLPAHLARSRAPGDSRDALRHRAEFLSGGYFDQLGDFLLAKCGALLDEQSGECVTLVDAGCGEGHLTQTLAVGLSADRDVSAIGVDISKWGVELASRHQDAIDWIVASNRDLPLVQGSVDLLTCVFGFPHLECFGRVLRPGGRVVIVEPGLDRTFYAKIRPISDDWIPEALKVSGHSREECMEFEEPEDAMNRFKKWVTVNGSRGTMTFHI